MNKSKAGFSLIETIVVIVVLAVIALTALPKLLNLSADANISVLKELKAAIKSELPIVYEKSIIQGTEKEYADSIVGPDGQVITTVFGYPSAFDHGIIAALKIDTTSQFAFVQRNSCNTNRNVPCALYIYLQGTTAPNSNNDGEICAVVYIHAYANSTSMKTNPPTIGILSDGC